MGATQPWILVVDDDPDTCHNLADILTDLGYHVDTAPDGPSALDLVRQRPYDVALLDYKMPGMDGLALYREVKRLRADTVAIVVTAYASGTGAEETLAAGAWRVLPKPVDFARLLGLVEQAVGQPLVLVVDDDRDLCATLWDVLRERHFRVGLAHDAGEAEERVRETAFQAVLLDLKLPAGSGADVFRRVRQLNPRARTIVITGHRAELDGQVQGLLDEGADAVCYKPFDVPKLLETLGRLTRPHPGPEVRADGDSAGRPGDR
jgi:two-component system, NtrC family, response regulator HydG